MSTNSDSINTQDSRGELASVIKIPDSIVFATGCPHSGWDQVLPLLQNSGLVSISDLFLPWHEEIHQLHGINSLFDLQCQLAPQQDIEQKAVNILSTVPDHSFSLVADSRNLWLLDYWASVIPDAFFLLFYTNADTALMHALTEGEFRPEQYLNNWCAANRQLIQFQRRHRSRAFIFNASDAINNPEQFIEACVRINLKLDVRNQAQTPASPTPLLEYLVANKLIEQHPKALALQTELLARALPLTRLTSSESYSQDKIIECYIQHRTVSQDLQKQVSIADNKLQDAVNSLTKVNALNQYLVEENERIRINHEKTSREAINENGLLLSQLHQVQAELEKYDLKNQELTNLKTEQSRFVEELKATINKITAERNNQNKRIIELQTQIENLTRDNREYREKLDQALQQIKLLQECQDEINRENIDSDAGDQPLIKILLERLTNSPKTDRIEKMHWEIINKSGLFDNAWYLSSYPDVAKAKFDPITHYLRYGVKERRNPSPIFDTHAYLQKNPGLEAAGLNPLIHYIKNAKPIRLQ